jgi:tRNA (guanosine-2'-O-)-methyltransferase
MNSRRLALLEKVVKQRQGDLTVILENVIDPHNIGAVIRSCDSVGIKEIFVLFTEKMEYDEFVIGKRTSTGSRKWVDVHVYVDAKTCFEHVKAKYNRVLGTHLGETSKSLYELDLTQPTALLFGNERDGLSAEALSYTDGNFIIPQMGMAKSLNLSVACAISVFEALRQRQAAGFYENNPMPQQEQEALLDDYMQRKKEGLRHLEQSKYTIKIPPLNTKDKMNRS